MKVGFTCGSFDLVHAGHILMFEECSKLCDTLIVGLQDDPSLDRQYKNKPVQSYEERLIQLKAIKYITSIVPYKTEEDLFTYLSNNPPNVRFVGEDWRGRYFTGRELDIPVIYNSRGHRFSSSELRQRIYQEELNKAAKQHV